MGEVQVTAQTTLTMPDGTTLTARATIVGSSGVGSLAFHAAVAAGRAAADEAYDWRQRTPGGTYQPRPVDLPAAPQHAQAPVGMFTPQPRHADTAATTVIPRVV